MTTITVNAPGPFPAPPASALFARNSATGPTLSTAIGGGTKIPWNSIENGAAPGTDVPITPQVTGKVRVICTTVISDANASAHDVVIAQVQVDGVTQTDPQIKQTISTSPIAGFGTMTFVVDLTMSLAPHTVSVLLTAGVANIAVFPQSSTIDIQELPAATG